MGVRVCLGAWFVYRYVSACVYKYVWMRMYCERMHVYYMIVCHGYLLSECMVTCYSDYELARAIRPR